MCLASFYSQHWIGFDQINESCSMLGRTTLRNVHVLSMCLFIDFCRSGLCDKSFVIELARKGCINFANKIWKQRRDNKRYDNNKNQSDASFWILKDFDERFR